MVWKEPAAVAQQPETPCLAGRFVLARPSLPHSSKTASPPLPPASTPQPPRKLSTTPPVCRGAAPAAGHATSSLRPAQRLVHHAALVATAATALSSWSQICVRIMAMRSGVRMWAGRISMDISTILILWRAARCLGTILWWILKRWRVRRRRRAILRSVSVREIGLVWWLLEGSDRFWRTLGISKIFMNPKDLHAKT